MTRTLHSGIARVVRVAWVGRVVLAALVIFTALVGCSGMQSPEASAGPLTAKDYFPLKDKAAWSYDSVETDARGVPLPGVETTLLLQRVERTDQAGGYFIRIGKQVALYEYGEGGVMRNGSVFLSAPFKDGAAWEGLTGDTYMILRADVAHDVPAGHFTHVVETSHTLVSGDLLGGTALTERYLYAPGVGVIEARVPVVSERRLRWFRLQLRGYTLDGEF